MSTACILSGCRFNRPDEIPLDIWKNARHAADYIANKIAGKLRHPHSNALTVAMYVGVKQYPLLFKGHPLYWKAGP